MKGSLFFNKDIIFSTVFVFLCIWLLQFSVVHLHALDPIEKALSDFDYSDLVFHYKKENPPPPSADIVIVEIGNNRTEIAQQLNAINRFNPKVVAIDAWFENPKTPEIDSPLITALSATKNLVIGNYLVAKEHSDELGVVNSFPAIAQKGSNAFNNFIAGYNKTIRYFHVTEKVDGKEINSFASEIVRLYNPSKFEALKKRNKEVEYINYSRPSDGYIPQLSIAEVNDSNPALELLRDKIVILGKIDNRDLEDLHFTPFNEELAGRSKPDMSGVFIHANIIEMTLAENYINKIPDWVIMLITVIITYIFIIFYAFFFVKKHIWYHLFAKVMQMVFLVVFIFLKLWLLKSMNLTFNDKIIAVPVILSVDLLYFYDALVKWLHNRFGYRTYFMSGH